MPSSMINSKLFSYALIDFDDDTKNSFVELYTKVDSGASVDQILEDQRMAEVNAQMNDNDSESDDKEDDQVI